MFDWIAENWQVVAMVIPGIITLASVIVKLTPNETDNEVLEAVIKFFEKLGLNTDPVKKKK